MLCTAYYDLLEAGFSLLLLQTTGLDLTFKQPLLPHHKYQLEHHLFVVTGLYDVPLKNVTMIISYLHLCSWQTVDPKQHKLHSRYSISIKFMHSQESLSYSMHTPF